LKNQSFALEVKGLTKVFGQLVAVDHVSFKVDQGEFFGFLGPNGAGKTTTIRMLRGIIKKNSGEAVGNLANKGRPQLPQYNMMP
jgi:ABC-type multidrug transport system ATPase subunit